MRAAAAGDALIAPAATGRLLSTFAARERQRPVEPVAALTWVLGGRVPPAA